MYYQSSHSIQTNTLFFKRTGMPAKETGVYLIYTKDINLIAIKK